MGVYTSAKATTDACSTSATKLLKATVTGTPGWAAAMSLTSAAATARRRMISICSATNEAEVWQRLQSAALPRAEA